MPKSLSPLKNKKIIKAGAGAGKTTRLLSEIYDFYLLNKNATIFVSTFTKKATQEIRDRLYALAKEKNDQSFLAFLDNEQVKVSTLHGLFYSILNSGADFFESSNDQFLDPQEYARLMNDAVLYYIDINKEDEDVKNLLSFFTVKEINDFLFKYNQQKREQKEITTPTEKLIKELLDSIFVDFKFSLEKFLNSDPPEKLTKILKDFLDYLEPMKSIASFEELFKHWEKPPRTPVVKGESDFSENFLTFKFPYLKIRKLMENSWGHGIDSYILMNNSLKKILVHCHMWTVNKKEEKGFLLLMILKIVF